MFICEIWLFHWYFLYSANLICRSTDFSKCFRGSLRLRDNESRLYKPYKSNFQLSSKFFLGGGGEGEDVNTRAAILFLYKTQRTTFSTKRIV